MPAETPRPNTTIAMPNQTNFFPLHNLVFCKRPFEVTPHLLFPDIDFRNVRCKPREKCRSPLPSLSRETSIPPILKPDFRHEIIVGIAAVNFGSG